MLDRLLQIEIIIKPNTNLIQKNKNPQFDRGCLGLVIICANQYIIILYIVCIIITP